MDNLSIKYPLFLSIFHYSECYHFHAVVTKIYKKTCRSLLRIIYSYFCELNFSSVYSVLCNKVPTYLVSTYNFGRWEIFHFNIMYLKICIATAIILLCIFNEPILTWITYIYGKYFNIVLTGRSYFSGAKRDKYFKQMDRIR